jgi:prophage tail gpP-like protein
MFNDRLSLQVGGFDYYGWKSIRVKHSIEQLAGVFSLGIHDRWDNTQSWPIEAGESCIVKIGDDAVITGYVDKTNVTLDPKSHTISVEGRDKTGDLVDCTADPREFNGLYFEQVANELIKPFGVTLLSDLSGSIQVPKNGESGAKLNKKSSNTGETVHSVLSKLAKMQGVLLVSDRVGNLVITRAGKSGASTDALVLGENVKSISYEKNFSAVFSEVSVKGQSSLGVQSLNLATVEKTVKPQATVTRKTSQSAASGAIGRFRPLTLQAEEQADASRCKARAMWEVSNREAKSKRITVIVQGWRQTSGKLWQINTLVKLKAGAVREDADYLIVSAEFSIDVSGGTITTLELRLKDAYTLLPEIPEKSTNASRPQTLLTVKKL